MYINFNLLKKHELLTKHLLMLIAINQQDWEMLNAITFLEAYNGEFVEDLERKNLVKSIKGKKNQSDVEKLRITSEGKKLLTEIQIPDYNDEIKSLLQELVEIYETNGQEIGNKRRVLLNLRWFLGKTTFDHNEIVESVTEWLANGYKTWLENLIWHRGKANVFTTLASRDLGESPLYEFMRRKYGLSI